jgi:hypothetical protein
VTQGLPCSEEDAWGCLALARDLCDAQGGYRGPAGSALVFLTFGGLTLSKPAPPETPKRWWQR